MTKMILEKYLGKHVCITLFNNEILIGVLQPVHDFKDAYKLCKPRLYFVSGREDYQFRYSDVKKCAEVRKNTRGKADVRSDKDIQEGNRKE